MDARDNLNAESPSPPAPEPSLQSLLARLQESAALASPAAGGSALPAADAEHGPSPTVSALLARLRASPAFTAAAAAPEGPVAHADAPLALAGGTAPPPPIDPVADTSARKLSFQDVLPRLAALGADAPFVDELVKMKREQQDTENKLWMDRLDVIKRQEARVREKRTQAKLVGSAAGLLSPFEAGQLHAAFAKELAAFDRATVLPALDGLRARQRAQLARLGVPGIAAADDELLAKIMQVLEGLAGA